MQWARTKNATIFCCRIDYEVADLAITSYYLLR